MQKRKGGFSAKKFDCVKCGVAFDAHPPDDLHYVASRDKKTHSDNIKIEYKCKNCKAINTIYWGCPETDIGLTEFE